MDYCRVEKLYNMNDEFRGDEEGFVGELEKLCLRWRKGREGISRRGVS